MYKDHRGYFREIMRGGIRQINQSFSKKGVVRGLHYQEPAVTKYVWVALGKIIDVKFDLETGEYEAKTLTPESDVFVIPKGYAHGFKALEDSVVCYAMDGEYNPEGDKGYNPEVVELLRGGVLSEKDRKAPKWKKF